MFEWLFKYPPAVYATAEWDFAFGGSPLWLLGAWVGAAVLAAAVLFGRRTLAPARRLGVFVAQMTLVTAALWILAQPELVEETPVAGSNTIALVLDDSASMRYRDNATPRLTAARDWLDAVAAELGDTYTIERLALSEIGTDLPNFANVAADADTTPLATRLAALIEQRRGDALAAIVLASDGLATERDTDNAVDLLKSAGVPVFSRRIGRTRVPEDLALSSVDVPDDTVAGAAIDAVLTIRHDRGGDARLRVLANDDRLLAAQTVRLDPDRQDTQVTVPLTLNEAGFQSLRFEVTPAADEPEPEPEPRNNVAQRVVAVPEREYRILYFEGEPRWEYKFMRRAIVADDDVQLTTLLRVSPNKYYRQGLADPSELEDGFPSDAATLFVYDAVILGSVEAAALSAEQQQLLHDFVSIRGGSLLLLAGRNGLGNGGWGESALGTALPTRLPAFGTDTFRRERLPVEPTSYGRVMPALAIDDTADGGWRDLPALADFQSVGAPRPAAQTLLTVRTATGREPLLVTQPYGRGMSSVLGTGGTWRWQMSLPVEDQRHERFWRQWLRTMVSAAPRRNSVKASPTGNGYTIEAEFVDAAWAPLTGLVVRAAIDGADHNETVSLVPVADRPGVYTADLAERGRGVHFIEASATRDGAVIATARTAVAGDSARPEIRRVRASDAALADLARASGGALVGANSSDELAALLRRSNAGVTELSRLSVWDAPVVFLLLLLSKTAEWLLRRRWGQI